MKGEAHRRSTDPSLRTSKRAVPNRPAWSGPARSAPTDEPDVISTRYSARGLGPRVQAWCYLCGSEHRRHEPCVTGARARPAIPSAVCPGCGDTFYHQRGKTRRIYCTSACRLESAPRQR